eukprot:4116060-Prymnesium_polylepis.2
MFPTALPPAGSKLNAASPPPETLPTAPYKATAGWVCLECATTAALGPLVCTIRCGATAVRDGLELALTDTLGRPFCTSRKGDAAG